MKIETILDQIDLGAMALPEFQRGYVWNRDQVRGLMTSLYRKHPVGSLLVWTTKTETVNAKGDIPLTPGSVKLLLDGQQRLTSLYGIVRGKPPRFFDGNSQAFSGLYFNLEDQAFEFYAPLKMKDNPFWIDVTNLMQIGAGEAIKKLVAIPEFQSGITDYINRLNSIDSIKNIDLHIEEVTGEDKTVDVVVDIFNQVNSGGTKLSKGDLALAKICAEWPDARMEMKKRLDKWGKAGFNFKLDWLLRCVNAILTGEALFSALKNVTPSEFEEGLEKTEYAIGKILDLISSRLGLDHDRVLGSRYSFPLLARYLMQRNGKLSGSKEQDELLFWYIQTFLWGRYSGSTESILNQDLGHIEEHEGALDRLIGQIRQNRGDLRLHPEDFAGWSRSTRFYPLLYMMTRVCKAKDWGSGVELSSFLLGNLSSLQLHHIFPKALLYQNGYSRPEVNALANFTFLTQETNLAVTNRDPAEYLEEYVAMHPGDVETHWIPMDRNLWKVENYQDFLVARRELLAKTANAFLDSLLAGEAPEKPEAGPSILDREVHLVTGAIESEEEEQALKELNSWVTAQGLPEGELGYELLEYETTEVIALVDLAWPNGLQEGLSQPVAFMIGEEQETIQVVTLAGYRCFVDVVAFKGYIQREVLAMDEADSIP
jgi:hypothetical protein